MQPALRGDDYSFSLLRDAPVLDLLFARLVSLAIACGTRGANLKRPCCREFPIFPADYSTVGRTMARISCSSERRTALHKRSTTLRGKRSEVELIIWEALHESLRDFCYDEI